MAISRAGLVVEVFPSLRPHKEPDEALLTVDGFSGFMRDAIKAAGLPLECQPHGLRKAAGRRLAEAGCSSRELMAVLGHKTLSEAERYTRDADQARLASAAVARLEGRSA